MKVNFQSSSGAVRSKLMHALIVPRPIALIITKSTRGQLNAAPFSFFNAVSGDPAIVAIGIDSSDREETKEKDTFRNIKESNEFVINLVSEEMVPAITLAGVPFPAEVDEVGLARLATAESITVDPPRIVQSPVALECSLVSVVPLTPKRNLILGEVQYAHIDDQFVTDADKFYIDTQRLRLVGRMHGGGWYARTTDQFQEPRLRVEDVPHH